MIVLFLIEQNIRDAPVDDGQSETQSLSGDDSDYEPIDSDIEYTRSDDDYSSDVSSSNDDENVPDNRGQNAPHSTPESAKSITDATLKNAATKLRVQLNSTSKSRVHGQKYIGYERKKELKSPYRVMKPSRSIKPRCNHKELKPKSVRSFMCGTFSEEDRKHAHHHFWNDLSNWDEKKAYVCGLVSTRGINRRRKSNSKAVTAQKKNLGHDIFLKKKDGIKVRVCRQFFLGTLDLGEDTFKRWTKPLDEKLSDDDFDSADDLENIKTPVLPSPAAKKRGRKHETSPSFLPLTEWIDALPKVPSHYCRASTSRVYVESTFNSRNHMYHVYSQWCTDEGKRRAGYNVFKRTLRERKITIHKPRKDQCDTCLGYKHGHVDEETYQGHIKRKTDGRVLKNKLKDTADESTLVVTMDLQSTLLSPKTLASAMYYKMKLQIHNFSIYELNTKNVELYVWDESQGGVSASEFTSCIMDYISKKCHFSKIVLISDGCVYQNRNRVLSSALSAAAKLYQIEISQVILEKGHTMMEVDSVHSTLEQNFRPPIYSPAEYHTRMRMARPDQPFRLNVIDHTFFKNFEKICTVSSIRPGRRTGDPVVTDIRRLRYDITGKILYTLDYSETWTEIPCRFVASSLRNIPILHSGRIPIDKTKFKQLQELKNVIPNDHHAFYDNLPN